MKVSNYYTPTLDEFHIGFEYEIRHKDEVVWNKLILNNELYNLGVIDYKLNKRPNDVRVKYLDKEDIESLGFVDIGNEDDINELSYQSSKNIIGGPSAGDDYKYILLYGLKLKELWVYKLANNGHEDDLFKGIIKNKSELKKLLKQLNIL